MHRLMTLSVLIALSAPAIAAKDATFLEKAIEGNYAEVQMGQLAQEKGQSQGVKSFGKTLEGDHQKALDAARDAAGKVNVAAPSGPNKKQQSDYDKMNKLSGADFDKEFADHMVMDHKKDIKEYEKETKQPGPAGEYANAQLPALRRHLEIAQKLKDELGR
jgi:putative membrane protein